MPKLKLIKTSKPKEKKFYSLSHKKHGIGGCQYTEPKPRKQDKRFTHGIAYAVVFFPKYKLGSGRAIWWNACKESIAQTKEAAIAKFMDSIAKGEKWETYKNAGWKVRKIKITDMGDV